MATEGNLLCDATSPYLLQHADNPVHWRTWGADALREAQQSNRPILLSVGYAACHWCHVMAHESFEDDETAALMNDLYVCIKVDREERPDVDHIYMTALHALGEQGGWPLTMFLTPAGEPFWGGTYFPPTPRWGRPSFRQVLQGVADAFRNDNEAIARNTSALKRTLQATAAPQPGEAIGPGLLDTIARSLLSRTDPVEGGMPGAPKFPNPPIFRFLWQNSFRTDDEAAREAVRLLLTKMSQGGIYDHLGGGYARYSTDAVWLAPHFEKMLYDNAQILELLAFAEAGQADPLYRMRADETVGWMMRDMTAEAEAGHAAFAASEDADSEGEEGRFYVWTKTEIDTLLSDDAAAFRLAYDVSPGGNWEGHTILRRTLPFGPAEAEERLARDRGILLRARANRVRPGRDDKVLADWNGLAVVALCKAAAVWNRPEWLARAQEAFAFIEACMSEPDGRVIHAYRLGRSSAKGQLDDQAACARAAIALFEATGASAYLDTALRIAEAAELWFGDAGSGYFATGSDADDLPLAEIGRPRIVADNATPSGNGMMADVLARLFHLTGDDTWRIRCEACLQAFSGLGERLAAAPSLLAAADLLEEAAVVVIADGGDPATARELRRVANAAADPAVCVISAGAAAAVRPDHPAFGQRAAAGSAVAFVCRSRVCGLPVGNPAMLAALLRRRGGVLPT